MIPHLKYFLTWLAVFWLAFLLALSLVALAGAQSLHLPITDVRFNQRTVLVADPNRATLTLVPGGTVWVCAPHDGGKSCRPIQTVVAWLLENGN